MILKRVLIAMLLLISSVTNAAGRESGGGDSCEARIQEIRDDILSWIKNGGAERFEGLPISVNEYSSRMSEYLLTIQGPNGAYRPITQIECVHHPIEVQGLEKTCRFDLAPSPKITCDADAFMDKIQIDADAQYRLIHHEYAGLAKLEVPSGSQSSYKYSNQLSAFLEDQIVRKLAVKPANDLDPLVVQLRADFRAAGTPSMNALRLGNRWNCTFTKADKSSVGTWPVDITLTQTRNQVQAVEWDNGHATTLDFGLMDIIPGKGLYGTYSSINRPYQSETLIRVTKNGDLLIECAGDLVGPDYGHGDYWSDRFRSAPDAILGHPHKALSYARCVPELQ